MKYAKEQKVNTNLFTSNFANRLRKEGASDTKKKLYSKINKSYCLLYRIEDREIFFDSTLQAEAPAIYRIFLELKTITAWPHVTEKDIELSEEVIKLLKNKYSDRFILNQDDPGVVYSPGSKHKLEYNLAWVYGVVQSNKIARLISIPTRKSFLRRNKDGELSAFAYEVGALYKAGYRPRLTRKRRIQLNPPGYSKIGVSCKDIVPNTSDILEALDELHKEMYPEMNKLGLEVRCNFMQMMSSSTRNQLERHNKNLVSNITHISQLVQSINKVGCFKVDSDDEHQYIMLSVFLKKLATTNIQVLKNKITSLLKHDSVSRNEKFSLSETCTQLQSIRQDLKETALKAIQPQRGVQSASSVLKTSKDGLFGLGRRKRATLHKLTLNYKKPAGRNTCLS